MSNMKTILSFDVGVKNLSFCLATVEYLVEERKLLTLNKIIDWRVVNIEDYYELEKKKKPKTFSIQENVELLIQALEDTFEFISKTRMYLRTML